MTIIRKARMFSLPDSWVWDFWFADDGESYHLFFLYASRALHDPEARHYRASIGHAVSSDLRDWNRVADALVRSDEVGFDDLATWTDDRFQFDLANGALRGWNGTADATINFGFIGVRERPVAADMDQDGIEVRKGHGCAAPALCGQVGLDEMTLAFTPSGTI